ncbi:hypothetical protein [[Clostridium] symbiosum]
MQMAGMNFQTGSRM